MDRVKVELVDLVDDEFSYFDTRQIDKHNHMMLNPLRYKDEFVGDIQVPQGFVTDFASINTLRNIGMFILFALLAGYGNKSATIHDFLYRGGLPFNDMIITREKADDIYYRSLRKEGIARWRAKIFFYGVRLFGEDAWKGTR